MAELSVRARSVGAIRSRPVLAHVLIGKEEAAADSPELVESDGDGHDHKDHGKITVHPPATIGDFQQVTQPSLSVRPDLGEDDPGPTHSIRAAQVIPDVR